MLVNKLVLIDGFAVLHRAYHALPSSLTTRSGEPINAVYGLVSMLLRVILDIKPTHIIVCFDESAKTFRQKEFPAYQSQRPSLTDEFSSQVSKSKKTLEAMGIPFYSKPGFEADDIIGTIAYEATNSEDRGLKIDNEVRKSKIEVRNQTSKLRTQTSFHTSSFEHPNSVEEVVIVTGDRDILQLVTDKVKVYMPVKGLSEGKLFGEKETVERLGVKPENIVDYKALVGDPSDNYPGVSGIGPKTAISLIEKFDSLDNIYKNLDTLPEKISMKLKNGKENAYISYKLATIIKDVPVKFDIEKAAKWDIDGKPVLELFQEFGFKTLTERVKKVGHDLVTERQGTLL